MGGEIKRHECLYIESGSGFDKVNCHVGVRESDHKGELEKFIDVYMSEGRVIAIDPDQLDNFIAALQESKKFLVESGELEE